jgi:hypothetical protein
MSDILQVLKHSIDEEMCYCDSESDLYISESEESVSSMMDS